MENYEILQQIRIRTAPLLSWNTTVEGRCFSSVYADEIRFCFYGMLRKATETNMK